MEQGQCIEKQPRGVYSGDYNSISRATEIQATLGLGQAGELMNVCDIGLGQSFELFEDL